LKVDAWKEGNNIIFSTTTVERKLEVVRGVVEIRTELKPKLWDILKYIWYVIFYYIDMLFLIFDNFLIIHLFMNL